MPNYVRVILGRKNVHAAEYKKAGFIGANFDIDLDLTADLDGPRKKFAKKYISIYRKKHQGKGKLAAGLACGSLWTICAELQQQDIVFAPTGDGGYYVGEISGPYIYDAASPLPHKRPVVWRQDVVERSKMSPALQNCAGSIATTANLTKFAPEIEQLLAGQMYKFLVPTDESIEDPHSFALEMHLEEFLVHNWQHTELGKRFEIWEMDGQAAGRQYQTSTGRIDILAISKDKKELLVVELKKGRASDRVVGQVQRYMGCVKSELAEDGQVVKGVIIASSDDPGFVQALKVTQNIEFFKYQVKFQLMPGSGHADAMPSPAE